MLYRYRPSERGQQVDAKPRNLRRAGHQMNAAPAPYVRPLERQGTHPNPMGCRERNSRHMLTRATTNAVAHRASSMRRMRRRAVAANRLYCATNGCTSFLVVDELGGVAHCEICGYVRRLN